MKKSLIFGLGMVLMALQANVWAATCATEKKGKGYTLRVLSPGPGTVINKSAPFLLQWQDPAQSMGIKVNVSLHKLAGTKKTPKTIKNLLNQPNTGNVLLTGTNLTLPGKATATDQYFLRISGTGKLVIDSECFAFAPALKGGPKQQANAEQEALQLTVQTYATQIAALTKEVAALKEQLAVTGAGIPRKEAAALKEMLAVTETQGTNERVKNNVVVGAILRLILQRVNDLTAKVSDIENSYMPERAILDSLGSLRRTVGPEEPPRYGGTIGMRNRNIGERQFLHYEYHDKLLDYIYHHHHIGRKGTRTGSPKCNFGGVECKHEPGGVQLDRSIY